MPERGGDWLFFAFPTHDITKCPSLFTNGTLGFSNTEKKADGREAGAFLRFA
jgi:hypothetical protein